MQDGKRERKKLNDFHRRLEEEIPRLRRYARALTRNSVRADDLVQDTLALRFVRNIYGSAVPISAPGSFDRSKPRELMRGCNRVMNRLPPIGKEL